MGFLITSEYTEPTTATTKTNIYVRLRNFEVVWSDMGEPLTRKYFVSSTYQLCQSQGASRAFYSNTLRFECTKAETESNIPALIYAYVKSNLFAGQTFEDVV